MRLMKPRPETLAALAVFHIGSRACDLHAVTGQDNRRQVACRRARSLLPSPHSRRRHSLLAASRRTPHKETRPTTSSADGRCRAVRRRHHAANTASHLYSDSHARCRTGVRSTEYSHCHSAAMLAPRIHPPAPADVRLDLVCFQPALTITAVRLRLKRSFFSGPLPGSNGPSPASNTLPGCQAPAVPVPRVRTQRQIAALWPEATDDSVCSGA